MIWRILVCVLCGYACGCVSFGFLVGKYNHVDLRNYGSGNIGATNTIRTLGKKAGAIAYIGDVLKAMIPMLLVRFVIFKDLEYAELLEMYTGLGVVLGHNFPFWLKFKGGKGIAVTSGVMATFAPFGIPLYLASFVIAVGITKYVSVGSLVIATIFPIWVGVTRYQRPHYVHILIICVVFTLMAFYRHKTNLIKIKNGNENKIGQKQIIKKDNEK